MAAPVFILGGAQSDFAVNWARQGGGLFGMMAETCRDALAQAGVEPGMVQAAHVGNFAAELFCGQGLLGGFVTAIDPAFVGIPTARHEAACASGSVAALAAMAEIEAGRYDLVLVLGAEQMRNAEGDGAAQHLGAACWRGREFGEARYVWPAMFSRLADEYDRRYGLDDRHLAAIARLAYANGRRNPLSQTRGWSLPEAAFAPDDQANPVVEGRIRRQDCGRVTDGAAAILLASARFAEGHARRHGLDLARLPRILGWGQTTSLMRYDDKIAASRDNPYVLPHLRRAMLDALARAGLPDIFAVDAVELHDCFTVTEYAALDHLGLTPPGQSWRAIEDGVIAPGGRLPVNPSGGLIGHGHPVGATGVRMLLDAARQVSGQAGPCQVEGARQVATLNIGGAATAVAAFVVGA